MPHAAVLQIGNSQIEFVIAASGSSLLPWFLATILTDSQRRRMKTSLVLTPFWEAEGGG
jgi:hypothetical protein